MNRRRGFTLIETLIATSLAAFLLAVVWTMFDIYTKLEDKGVRASESAAVVRAIQRQLRRDLMQLATIDASRASPINQNAAAQSPYPSNGYLYGTADELHFITQNRSGQETLRAVSYLAQKPELGQRPSMRLEEKTSEDSTSGASRLERSWLAFQSDRLIESTDLSKYSAGREFNLQQDDFLFIGADQNNQPDQETFPAAPEVRDDIPEIAKWSFRYFDGGRWVDRWDSGWHRRPPQAIEIGFDLNNSKSRDDDDDDVGITLDNEQPKPEHRFVISLSVNPAVSTREVPR